MSLKGDLKAIVFLIGIFSTTSSPTDIDNELRGIANILTRDASDSSMYGHQGADWPGLCKTGSIQSPIEIDVNTASDIPRALPIVFVNYNLCKFTFNIGATTVGITPVIEAKHQLGIAAGGLRGFYKLASGHFHWGAEHIVNHKRDALELHLVHYKNVYSGVAEAKNHPNGLAVLAVIYEIGDEDAGIQKLIEAIESKSSSSSLTAEELLPESTDEYYRYSGSLTTPGCDESVVWTVFKTQRTMSQKQIDWFKTLPMKDGKPLESNYRVIQKTKRRKVYNAVASYV